jgi:hypothetical protein
LDELHPNSKRPTIGLETAVPIVSILIVTLFADFTSDSGADIAKSTG